MARRRFASDREEVYSEEGSDDNGQTVTEDESSDSEEPMDTQEEAFNKYSDFQSSTHKNSTKQTKRKSNSSSTVPRIRNSNVKETPWDVLLKEFEKRNVSEQQVKMIVSLVGALVLFIFVSNVFFPSRRYSTLTDLVDCSVVTTDDNREVVQCTTRDGYNLRVIESKGSSILLEVSKGVSGSSIGSLAYFIYSLVKYSTYILLGVAFGAFVVTDEGKEKWKLLKRKYLEISAELQRKAQRRMQAATRNLRQRDKASSSSSSDESSESETDDAITESESD